MAQLRVVLGKIWRLINRIPTRERNIAGTALSSRSWNGHHRSIDWDLRNSKSTAGEVEQKGSIKGPVCQSNLAQNPQHSRSLKELRSALGIVNVQMRIALVSRFQARENTLLEKDFRRCGALESIQRDAIAPSDLESWASR